jgi:dihydrofolate synthase/folylpolyglutamate synthase
LGWEAALDATNAVDRIVSVITTLDLDHQNILGATIEEIAGEKAAIIVPGARSDRAPAQPGGKRCVDAQVSGNGSPSCIRQ